MTHSADHPPHRPLFIALAYAAFAGLWIIFSDQTVEWLFNTPAHVTLANTVKGGTFVVVTSLLLYFLLQRHSDARPADTGQAGNGDTNWRELTPPLALLSALIIAITITLSLNTREQKKAAEVARLQAVSLLKTEQIAAWLHERQSDAKLLQNSPFLAEAYQRWRQQGDIASRDRLFERLNAYRKEGVFHGVVLLDEQGTQLWKTSDSDREQHRQIAAAERARFLAAVARENISRLGPYLDTAGRIHLDYVLHLALKGGQRGPVIVLHSDAGNYFPVSLGAWPLPSASGEVFLFKRDGDHFLYLSALRYRADAAMKLRLPLANNNLAPAQVINDPGKLGQLAEGIDYRGIEVAGVTRAIPDTDWYLMTKLDRREMLADATRSVTWIALSGLLSLFVAGAGLVLFRQRQQIALAQNVQLAQSERLRALHLLAAIADSSSDAIFAKDMEGRYILFNRKTAQVTGKTDEQALGQDDNTLLSPEQTKMVRANDQLVIAENRTITFDETLTTTQGERTFQATKGPLRDSAGKVIGIFGIARDITEREQAEQHLRATLAEAQRFREALNHVSAYIYMKDTQSRYVYANRPTLELFGCTSEELAGSDDTRFFPPDIAQHLQQVDARVFAGENTAEEIDVPATKGEHHVYWEVKTPIYADAEGTTIWGLCGISTDITTRKAAENNLQRQTDELRVRNEELERFSRATVGRELDMIALKQRINAMAVRLGEAPPYSLDFLDPAEKGSSGINSKESQ